MNSNRSQRIPLALGAAAGGLLAAGLGIGVASAEPSTDPYTWSDQLIGGLSAPAETTSALDMQISIDGMDLFPTAGNTATATTDSGDLGIAIAIGNGADANATGGVFDFALADGTNSIAEVLGRGPLPFPLDVMDPGGMLASDFDVAAAFGDMANATTSGFFQVDIAP
jgi:hypothetical protein